MENQAGPNRFDTGSLAAQRALQDKPNDQCRAYSEDRIREPVNATIDFGELPVGALLKPHELLVVPLFMANKLLFEFRLPAFQAAQSAIHFGNIHHRGLWSFCRFRSHLELPPPARISPFQYYITLLADLAGGGVVELEADGGGEDAGDFLDGPLAVLLDGLDGLRLVEQGYQPLGYVENLAVDVLGFV